ALNELLEEGVPARIQRYKHAAALIRNKMGELGMKPVLPAELQSNSLTAYHLPDGVTYQALHDKMKEQGYSICPGLGPLEDKIFRVANMGALTKQQIEGFLTAFQKVMQTLPTR
ncbi:MAG: aminotransferase, partial [Nitrospirota bacterium]|nr:aminotransferase [Nitrospirota bacterium]